MEKIEIPAALKEKMSPQSFAQLERLVATMVEDNSENAGMKIGFWQDAPEALGEMMKVILENKVIEALGSSISEVLENLPHSLQILLYARLLAVAAAHAVKKNHEDALIESIFAKFREDFKKVRDHLETCECGKGTSAQSGADDDDQTPDDLPPEEINRRAEGIYEPGVN